MLLKAISAGLALALLLATIVVPAHRAVNFEPRNPQVADGSPLPIPRPPVSLVSA